MDNSPITHEDILAFIQGWDLVRREDIITESPLGDDIEEEEELDDE